MYSEHVWYYLFQMRYETIVASFIAGEPPVGEDKIITNRKAFHLNLRIYDIK